jgi:hypothetical protein
LAGYDAACTYARVLGETGCLKILRASLREKRDAVAEEATILKGLLR